MRAANRYLRLPARSDSDHRRFCELSAPDNGLIGPDRILDMLATVRRDLRARAEEQMRMAARYRDWSWCDKSAAAWRDGHAGYVRASAADLAEWRALGGFLP